jgi:hypothetical protein
MQVMPPSRAYLYLLQLAESTPLRAFILPFVMIWLRDRSPNPALVDNALAVMYFTRYYGTSAPLIGLTFLVGLIEFLYNNLADEIYIAISLSTHNPEPRSSLGDRLQCHNLSLLYSHLIDFAMWSQSRSVNLSGDRTAPYTSTTTAQLPCCTMRSTAPVITGFYICILNLPV